MQLTFEQLIFNVPVFPLKMSDDAKMCCSFCRLDLQTEGNLISCCAFQINQLSSNKRKSGILLQKKHCQNLHFSEGDEMLKKCDEHT